MQSNVSLVGKFKLFTFISIATAVTIGSSSCDSQNTYSTDAQKQADQSAALRDQQIDSIVGNYCGPLHFLKNGVDYQVQIDLARGEDNVHSANTQDPTQTTQVPKVVGNLEFPIMDGLTDPEAFTKYPDLMKAMGNYQYVSFSEGDYHSDTNEIYLPFLIPGNATNFGEIRGQIISGTFTGTFYSEGNQNQGTFSATISACDSSGPTPTPSVSPTASPSPAVSPVASGS